jgi:hypothetical protein
MANAAGLGAAESFITSPHRRVDTIISMYIITMKIRRR